MLTTKVEVIAWEMFCKTGYWNLDKRIELKTIKKYLLILRKMRRTKRNESSVH